MLTTTGQTAAYKLNHARLLLKADINQESGGWTDQAISVATDISPATIERVRQRFVEEGKKSALARKARSRNKSRREDGFQVGEAARSWGKPP